MKQRRDALSRVVSTAALLLTGSGCSLIFVKTPPAAAEGRMASRSADCTSSKVAPILDSGFGAFELGRTVYAVAAPDSVYSDPNQPLTRGADIALGAAFTALFVGSAVYGYIHTGRCSSLHDGSEELEEAIPNDPPEKWDSPAPAHPRSGAASSSRPGTSSEPPPLLDTSAPGQELTPAPELPASESPRSPPRR